MLRCQRAALRHGDVANPPFPGPSPLYGTPMATWGVLPAFRRSHGVGHTRAVQDNTSVGHSPTSASCVGSSDTDSNLDRKLRMVLKACGIVSGCSIPKAWPGLWETEYPRAQPPGLLAAPYLVPHRFLRIHSKAAEHRQDLMGTVVHRIEIVCGSEAQDPRDPGRRKRVLRGPAEGGGEDPVSSLRAQMGGKGCLNTQTQMQPQATRPHFSLPGSGHLRSKSVDLAFST